MFLSDGSYADSPRIWKKRKGPPSGPFHWIPDDSGMTSLPGSSATSLDDFEVLQPRAEIAVLRVLALELDLQANVVHRVGVTQRVLVGDHVGLEEVEQRLVVGLHAQLARAAHERLHLVHLALED